MRPFNECIGITSNFRSFALGMKSEIRGEGGNYFILRGTNGRVCRRNTSDANVLLCQ